MNIVVPMAGAGSRFAVAGFELPKPLIPVRGEAMYRWAVSSLDLSRATRLIFVLRETPHLADLRRDIDQTFGAYNPGIVTVDHVTRGQAETLYLAKDLIDLDRPILVHNSDTAFTSTPAAWDFGSDDGVLHTFTSREERWSFARLGPDGLVDLVAEKKVISDHASTGTYYFRDTRALFTRLERMITDHTGGEELYIAPIYNELIADRRRITIRTVTQNLCLGTPHDLEVTTRELDKLDLQRTRLIAGTRPS